MRKHITSKTHLAQAMGKSALMVTHSPSGKDYATTHGIGVSSKLARGLLDCETTGPSQTDLFLVPNEDGLFPGFSQTWSLDS
jgi:hypothetical protein